MKKKVMLALVALVSTMAVMAQNADSDSLYSPERGVGLLVGYRGYDLGGSSYSHDTHPQDSFLPGANVPGSGGTTTLDGTSSFALLGFRFQPAPIAKVWTLNFDVGGLFGGQRDRHQNANDARYPGNGSFVYSEARFGMLGGMGLSYNLKRWSFGVQAEAAGIFVDHGWDRYAKDESAKSEIDWQFGAGPKIGFRLSQNFRLEAGAIFGGRAPMATFGITAWL